MPAENTKQRNIIIEWGGFTFEFQSEEEANKAGFHLKELTEPKKEKPAK